MLNIFINGRFLVQDITGVQRYGRELLKSIDNILLAEDNKDINIICLIPRTEDVLPQYNKIELKEIGVFQGNLWEQIDLPVYCGSNLLFSPANIGPFFARNQIVTIHDASVFAIPDNYSLLFKMKYKLTYLRLAQIAKQIITDSNFSKRELINYCSFDPENISVIGLGYEHILKIEADESIISKFGLKKNGYYLIVGSMSPHKNLKVIAQVDQILKSKKVKFVVTGGEFKKVFKNETSQRGTNFIYTGYVTDNELVALYQNAKALIFPSLYEGFGLPVIEALAVNCPVLCSTAASLPEVGGHAVSYFEPENPETLADSITMENYKISPDVVDEQLAKYTWKKCAERVFELLLRFAN